MLKKEIIDSLLAITAIAAFVILALYLLLQDVRLVGPI